MAALTVRRVGRRICKFEKPLFDTLNTWWCVMIRGLLHYWWAICQSREAIPGPEEKRFSADWPSCKARQWEAKVKRRPFSEKQFHASLVPPWEHQWPCLDELLCPGLCKTPVFLPGERRWKTVAFVDLNPNTESCWLPAQSFGQVIHQQDNKTAKSTERQWDRIQDGYQLIPVSS